MNKDTLQIITDTIHNCKVISVPLKDNISHQIIINQLSSQSTIWEKVLENSLTIIIALIAGLVALYQVKSNIVSTARIKWIETLREDISQLYHCSLGTVFYNSLCLETVDEQNQINHDKYMETHSKFFILSNKIRMQLNAKETKHQNLIVLLDQVEGMLDPKYIENTSQEEVEEILKRIVVISRSIFKIEWEKSKRIFKI